MHSTAAEIREIGAIVNATMDRLDDAESARGFLGNWFRSIPEALVGMRYAFEAFQNDSELQPLRFVDLTTGRISHGLPGWDGIDRLRLLPELRALTGDRAKFADWCLYGPPGGSKIDDVSYEDADFVRHLFRRVEDMTDGTGDDVSEVAAWARQNAEDRISDLLDAEDETLRRLEGVEYSSDAPSRLSHLFA